MKTLGFFFQFCMIYLASCEISNANSYQNINDDPLVVQTQSGLVEGITVETLNGKSVDVFRGIPYAGDTSGPNRFAPPKDPPKWTEIFQAISPPDSCTQGFIMVYPDEKDEFWKVTGKESENCLTLNIWVPKPRKSNLPVLLWIHGGGFQEGGSSTDFYDGGTLASEEEIIVISINYRLSIFGFIYLDLEEAPGNVGIRDQQAALLWVQNNIKSFGGDPAKVTIAGESAGGVSVGYHLLLPSSSGLFNRAILQSATLLTLSEPNSKLEALAVTMHLAKRVGCGARNRHSVDYERNVLICLRSKSTEEIQLAIKNMTDFFLPFGPVLDYDFLAKHPKVILKQRRFESQTQVMIGHTAEDGLIMLPIFIPDLVFKDDTYFTQSEIREVIKRSIPSKCGRLADAVMFNYINWDDPVNPDLLRAGLTNFLTDQFVCSDNEITEQLSLNGNSVFKYRFKHKPSNSRQPLWTGSMHGDEIAFIFGAPFDNNKGFSDADKTFSKTVMRYWANFVKNGDPNDDSSDLLMWPRYTSHKKLSLDLCPSPRVQIVGRLRECAFWNRVFPSILASSRTRQQ